MFYKEYTKTFNRGCFMSRCKICSTYNDPYEWPEEMVPNFRQDMCFSCYQKALDAGELDQDNDDDTESEQDLDAEIDPEIDDTPILDDEETDQQTNKEEEDTLNATTYTGNEPDESASIRNLRQMLFG